MNSRFTLNSPVSPLCVNDFHKKKYLTFFLNLGGGNLLRQAPKSLDSIGGGNILRQLDSIGGGNILRGASDHHVPRYHGYFEKRGYDPMR